MYLRLDQWTLAAKKDVIGIFDLDTTTQSHRTRAFLERAEREGRLTALGDDLPKSFVVCARGDEKHIYISQLSPATLRGRAEGPGCLE